MKVRASYTFPLELTHDIIRGKWKPIILWQLGKGAASLSTLQNDIVGIGQKIGRNFLLQKPCSSPGSIKV